MFCNSGKRHSRCKDILWSYVLSQQCCDVYFISLTVGKPLWNLTPNITEITPPNPILAGSALTAQSQFLRLFVQNVLPCRAKKHSRTQLPSTHSLSQVKVYSRLQFPWHVRTFCVPEQTFYTKCLLDSCERDDSASTCSYDHSFLWWRAQRMWASVIWQAANNNCKQFGRLCSISSLFVTSTALNQNCKSDRAFRVGFQALVCQNVSSRFRACIQKFSLTFKVTSF